MKNSSGSVSSRKSFSFIFFFQGYHFISECCHHSFVS